MNKLVSIVLASYNGSKYISEQIDSIINQNYNNFELIIIDDCSSDNTLNILHHYERLDNRIRVFSNKLNCGCSQTFENALSYVNGEYIAFCDQDDVWRPDKLSIMIDILKNESIGLVYSNCDVIDEESNIKIDNYREINNLVGIDSSHENINEICWFNSFILGCSIVIKFDVLSKVLPILDNSHNHDKWIVSLSSNISNIKYIDEKLFSYRIHGNNLSIKKNKVKVGFFELIQKYFKKNIVPVGFNKFIINKIVISNVFLDKISRAYQGNKLLFLFRYGKFMYLRDSKYKRSMLIINWLIRGQ